MSVSGDMPADDSLAEARERERDALVRNGVSAAFMRLQRLCGQLRQEGASLSLSFSAEQRAANAATWPGLPLFVQAQLAIGSLVCAVEVPVLGNRGETVRLRFPAGDSAGYALADSSDRESLLQRLRALAARQDALAELLGSGGAGEGGAELRRELWHEIAAPTPQEERAFGPELVIIDGGDPDAPEPDIDLDDEPDGEPDGEPEPPEDSPPSGGRPVLPLPRLGGKR